MAVNSNGHLPETFASDMKCLQEICELANSSTDEQLHLTCVAHKSIKSYGSALQPEMLNAFMGVEGRLVEKTFLVSSQNNYQLIADAITKKEEFGKWSEGQLFKDISETGYEYKGFNSLFTRDDYERIVAKGCFPLTPVTAMLLLNLSEKIAQNERTLFTFIAGKEKGCLTKLISTSNSYIGVDSVFDYFAPLMEEENDSYVHHEWLKADYALELCETPEESSIIKAIAIIHIVNRPDEINGAESFIRMATGLTEDSFSIAAKGLMSRNILEFRDRTKTYEFKTKVGIDVENAVVDIIAKRFMKSDMTTVLDTVLPQTYITPKKHNQVHHITRYFNYKLISQDAFLAMKSLDYLVWKNEPDGVVLFILPTSDLKKNTILAHLRELEDYCVVLYLPCSDNTGESIAKKYLAVNHLKQDTAFIEENPVYLRELEQMEQDTAEEVIEWFQKTYLQSNKVYTGNGRVLVGKYGLNRIVSDICDNEYCSTPIIKNELINRHNVTGATVTTRKNILSSMLSEQHLDEYMHGTSAESTVYRALVNAKKGTAMISVGNIIKNFIIDSIGKKQPFLDLLGILTSPPYGMRRGVLPFYILDELLKLEDMPVIYLKEKEVQITPEILINIIKSPAEYYLYVEKETVQKTIYINELRALFSDYEMYCNAIDKRNELARIVCWMQSWYISLPQAAKLFDKPYPEMPYIKAIRSILSEPYLNPRDVLFDKIPSAMKVASFDKVIDMVRMIRIVSDRYVYSMKEDAAQTIRHVFSFGIADLKNSFSEWYRDLPKSVLHSVMSQDAANILKYIKGIDTGNELEIASRIAKIATGTYVEDWKEGMDQDFATRLGEIYAEIMSNTEPAQDSRTVAFEDGTELYYSFDPENITTTGTFFRNALEDLIDEYEDTIDNSEKAGLLIEAVRNLLGEK